MRRLLTGWLLHLSLGGPAWALPALQTQHVNGMALQVPTKWTVRAAQQPVPSIQLTQREGDPTSPTVLLVSLPLQAGTPTMATHAEQLVQATIPNAKRVSTHTDRAGVLTEIWQGDAAGTPAKMATMVSSQGSVGFLVSLAAPTAAFDELGGVDLIVAILNPPPPKKTGQLQIPKTYAASPTPALHYLAEEFDRLSPAQVAQALRQLNPEGRQMLAIYGAFGNLLHWIACRADPTAPSPSGETCAQTNEGWRLTLQFLGDNIESATSQAQTERNQILTSARCADGRIDAATCQTYYQTQTQMNQMNHDTMRAIIHTMDPAACTVGEAGCVPIE